jgi:hypothetical protein
VTPESGAPAAASPSTPAVRDSSLAIGSLKGSNPNE